MSAPYAGNSRCPETNTAKMQQGARLVAFGLGGIGLNVIQGAWMAGAEMIVGIDLNWNRKAIAEKFSITHFVNPTKVAGDLVPHLGGARGRTDVPRIVDWSMDGKINIDDLITHVLPFEQINDGFDLLRRGESIRTVAMY